MNFSGIHCMDGNSLRCDFESRKRGKEKLMPETTTYSLSARRRTRSSRRCRACAAWDRAMLRCVHRTASAGGMTVILRRRHAAPITSAATSVVLALPMRHTEATSTKTSKPRNSKSPATVVAGTDFEFVDHTFHAGDFFSDDAPHVLYIPGVKKRSPVGERRHSLPLW